MSGSRRFKHHGWSTFEILGLYSEVTIAPLPDAKTKYFSIPSLNQLTTKFVLINIKHFRYIEVFRSSLVEAQRAQYGGGSGGRGGGRGYGGRGGRPGPYDRMGPPLGRGFGYSGPGAGGRGPRGPMK